MAPMGMAKEMMIEQDEQGWDYSDKFVCPACVRDEHLADAVAAEAADSEHCDFCGAKPAAAMDVLLAAFMVGVRRDYNDADGEGIYWEGREGGYQASTLDSWDLVDHYGDAFEPRVAEEVRASLHEQTWVERNYAWRRRDDVLRDAWDAFSDAVKYETRYVIWIVESEDAQLEARHAGEVPVGEILHEIGQFLQILGVVRELPAGATLWRAQTHSTRTLQPAPSAGRLGTAPREYAKQPNRMSPAGIPMFYGAMEARTALEEVRRHNDGGDRYVTLGEFTLSESIRVVDFTRLPEIPSVFHPQLGEYHREIAFLHEFVGALSRPVKPGDEAIDYVPTQVVTEFFLRILAPAGGSAIKGLVYASAVHDGGKSNVLDIPHDHCVAVGEPRPASGACLVLTPSTVQRHRLATVRRGMRNPAVAKALRWTASTVASIGVLALIARIARAGSARQ